MNSHYARSPAPATLEQAPAKARVKAAPGKSKRTVVAKAKPAKKK
jgi:hypothetical protein